MTKALYFDMDGTIVDLYGVESWLYKLEHEDSSPYITAQPLINMSHFARALNKAKKLGFSINIVSWTSKNGSYEYNKKVAQAKQDWIKKHLPSVTFDSIDIVDYGTPKNQRGEGILFDDEEKNRNDWNGQSFDAHDLVKTIYAVIA